MEGHLRFFFSSFLETLCRKFFHATDNMEKVHKNLKYVQIYIFCRFEVDDMCCEFTRKIAVIWRFSNIFVGIKTATIIKVVRNSGSYNEIYYRKPG